MILLTDDQLRDLHTNLDGYLATLARIEQINGQLRMANWLTEYDASPDLHNCGTVACVAGWHAIFNNPGSRMVDTAAAEYVMHFADAYVRAYEPKSREWEGPIPIWVLFSNDSRLNIAWLLFGTTQDYSIPRSAWGDGVGDDDDEPDLTPEETIAKLRRRAIWLQLRIERQLEARQRIDMPRAQRWDHAPTPETLPEPLPL